MKRVDVTHTNGDSDSRDRGLVAPRVVGRDLLLRTAFRVPSLRPWHLAGACFLSGFGALSVFYLGLVLVGSPLMHFRGLFSYNSATIGDGLLLPLAVAVSASALLHLECLLQSEMSGPEDLRSRAQSTIQRLQSRFLAWIPPISAASVTVGIHVLWLLNPKTEPNWTLPGRLNVFGYWHAVFFAIMIWWFIAVLLRLTLTINGIFLRYKCSRRSFSATLSGLKLWGDINVLLACLAGFATLLYVDNYGLHFQIETFLASASTVVDLLVTVLGIGFINAVFFFRVYRPSVRRAMPEELIQARSLAVQSWLAFGSGLVMVLALFALAVALPRVTPWPLAGIAAGLMMPILFAENYASNLFLNHNRIPDAVQTFGILLVLVVAAAGLVTATGAALQGGHIRSFQELSSGWWMSVIVSAATAAACLLAAWLASRASPIPHVTDETPMHNLVQNYAMFWALYVFVVLWAVLFVNRLVLVMVEKLGSGGTLALLIAYTSASFAVVSIPLYNNYRHLRDMERRKTRYVVFRYIRAHVLVVSLYVALVWLCAVTWMWFAFLDVTLR